jgi:endonuclease G
MARRSSDSGGFLFKTGIFAVLAGVAFWLFNQFGGKKNAEPDAPNAQTELPAERPENVPAKPKSSVSESILPISTTGEVVRHGWFTLSYSEDHEQAEWVAYELTRARLNENWAERPNTFRPDPEVRTESATPRDYNASGYDRGHLCPAADMAFDAAAIDETFFMSNISPQVPAFNVGVWRELEELTRDWARKFERLYVVTGPVLSQTAQAAPLGFSKVTVPSAFYKVLVAPEQRRAIAFVLPNALNTKPVMDFACSIDRAEKATGLDFFPNLLKGLDEELEASLDKDAWPVDRARQEERMKVWNKR